VQQPSGIFGGAAGAAFAGDAAFTGDGVGFGSLLSLGAQTPHVPPELQWAQREQFEHARQLALPVQRAASARVGKPAAASTNAATIVHDLMRKLP